MNSLMFKSLIMITSIGLCSLAWSDIVIRAPLPGKNIKNNLSGSIENGNSSIRLGRLQEDRTAILAMNALNGDVDAMVSLGHHYYLRPDLTQARILALRWWKQAAEAGDARAMAGYGYLLSGAMGGRRELTQARQWLRRAQLMGMVRATYLLALIERSIDGPKQTAKARALLRQAAQAGDAYAMNDLGVELELAGDFSAAAVMYDRADQAGVERARQNLYRMQTNGLGRTTETLQRLRTLAEEGDAAALSQLAQFYHLGQGGVQADYARALFYYREAANAGSQEARDFLALIIHPQQQGGVPIDMARMREIATRMQSAALWSSERNASKALERPARMEDPLADLVSSDAADLP